MMSGGETKRFSWLRFESKRYTFIWPWATISRLRKELSATESLLAEANRKLRAGGRACADRHRGKVMSKAAETRGE